MEFLEIEVDYKFNIIFNYLVQKSYVPFPHLNLLNKEDNNGDSRRILSFLTEILGLSSFWVDK